MKRFALLCAVAVMLLVGCVAATNVYFDFQTPADYNLQMKYKCEGSPCYHGCVDSTDGSNNYCWVEGYQNGIYSNGNVYMAYNASYPAQYAAVTVLSGSTLSGVYATKWVIKLYDNAGVLRYTAANVYTKTPFRLEMKMSGNIANIYVNGTLSNQSSSLAQYPSTIWFGTYAPSYTWGTTILRLDDLVVGSDAPTVDDTPDKYVFGAPNSQWYLKKDFINPSSSGYYNINGTLADSDSFPTTYSKGQGSAQTVVLKEYSGASGVYQSYNTGSIYANVINWNLTEFFAANPPYGLYTTTIQGVTSRESGTIPYIGSGATVYFDKEDYSVGSTAAVSYSIVDTYWDTDTYDYSVDILSATTGTVVSHGSLSSKTGTEYYTFTESDEIGAYYAAVIATPRDGVQDPIWMNYDYANLDQYVTFSGYVKNQTDMVLEGANVSISQGDIAVNQITAANGTYSATGFLSGDVVVFNITKSGYSQYYAATVPLSASEIPLNFTINSTTFLPSGLGIGGVAREGTFTDFLITNGYGRPIENVDIYAKNSTTCHTTTNGAGWYVLDESTGCTITDSLIFDVWGQGSHYNNSQNYSVVT